MTRFSNSVIRNATMMRTTPELPILPSPDFFTESSAHAVHCPCGPLGPYGLCGGLGPFQKIGISEVIYIYIYIYIKSDMKDKYYNITYQHIACKNTCTRFLQSDHCTRHLVSSIWRNQLSCHGILKDIHTLIY